MRLGSEQEQEHDSQHQAANTSRGVPFEQLLGLSIPQENAGQPAPRPNPLRSNFSDLSQRPDKVGHIKNNWKLRFSGAGDTLGEDSFIYEVEALTHKSLKANFTLLCSNANTLLECKAAGFFGGIIKP